MSLNELACTERARVDAPALDELDRAKELAACLANALQSAEHHSRSWIHLDRERAEELCQLLHDSIRTAEQLKQGSRR